MNVNGRVPSFSEENGGRTVAKKLLSRTETADVDGDGAAPQSALAADIIIENAPDPVFVADLKGKILQANEAVSQLPG